MTWTGGGGRTWTGHGETWTGGGRTWNGGARRGQRKRGTGGMQCGERKRGPCRRAKSSSSLIKIAEER